MQYDKFFKTICRAIDITNLRHHIFNTTTRISDLSFLDITSPGINTLITSSSSTSTSSISIYNTNSPHKSFPSKTSLNISTYSINIFNTNICNTIQILSVSILLVLNDLGCKKLKIALKWMNISDIFTNKNIDTKLSQYIVFEQKKILGLL